MSVFLAELIGTAILILLGNGVVANVSLNKSKGKDGGWMVIATGWALAVTIPVFIFGPTSGAHFNPAVTLAMAVIGRLAWNQVSLYIMAQLIGAVLGGCLVYLYYLPHWKETPDSDVKLSCFATGPAIDSLIGNLISECISTFILVFAILGVANTEMIEGLALGGPTGYAINPARDLGPRIAHAILPIPGKRNSNWSYAWIPVAAPIVGGIVAAITFSIIF